MELVSFAITTIGGWRNLNEKAGRLEKQGQLHAYFFFIQRRNPLPALHVQYSTLSRIAMH